MSTLNECVIRLVPDQMTVLNSRERTPFLLFVETVEYLSPSQALGTVKRIVDNAEQLQPEPGACVRYTSLRFNTLPSEPGAGGGPDIMYSQCVEDSQRHQCFSSDVTDPGITHASIVSCPCRKRVPSVRFLASQEMQGTAPSSSRLLRDQGQQKMHLGPSLHRGEARLLESVVDCRCMIVPYLQTITEFELRKCHSRNSRLIQVRWCVPGLW